MFYLYKITNIKNNKVYIGQSKNDKYRWRRHTYYARHPDKSNQCIHRAMSKHGIDNFIYELIASAKNKQDADAVEKLLIIQYNSLNRDFGYNIKPGGTTAGHSEETRKKLSISYKKYLQEHGHPCQGQKRTPEQIERMCEAQQKRYETFEFTPELRQRMSDSHKGQVHPKEVVEKRKVSLKATTDAKTAAKIESGEYKCNAAECNIQGKHKYKIINDVRYCAKHAERLIRTGTLELLPRKPVHNKGKIISEETRLKLLGRTPHNKYEFSQEQIEQILTDPRGSKRVAVDFGVTEKVIARVRRENKK